MAENSQPKRPSYWGKLTLEERNEWLALYGQPLESPPPGAPVDASPEPEVKQPPERLAFVWAVGGLLIILLVALFLEFGPSSSRSTSGPREVVGGVAGMPGKREAYYAMQGFVSSALKSPSTAKFQSAWDVRVFQNDEFYQATFYVDAQNSFGAMLRERYTVALEYRGRSWQLVSITSP